MIQYVPNAVNPTVVDQPCYFGVTNNIALRSPPRSGHSLCPATPLPAVPAASPLARRSAIPLRPAIRSPPAPPSPVLRGTENIFPTTIAPPPPSPHAALVPISVALATYTLVVVGVALWACF